MKTDKETNTLISCILLLNTMGHAIGGILFMAKTIQFIAKLNTLIVEGF
jgi:hypothetical protein